MDMRVIVGEKSTGKYCGRYIKCTCPLFHSFRGNASESILNLRNKRIVFVAQLNCELHLGKVGSLALSLQPVASPLAEFSSMPPRRHWGRRVGSPRWLPVFIPRRRPQGGGSVDARARRSTMR